MTNRLYPRPGQDKVRAVAEATGPLLTLIVPVSGSQGDSRQIALRHKQSVERGIARWREVVGAAAGAEAEGIAKAREALVDFAAEDSLPIHSVESRVAIWSATEGLQIFGLPFACPEAARVAHTAVLRPLVRASLQPGRFRVLTLSPNRVALFEGDEDSLARVEASGLPESLADALGTELTDSSLQFHSAGGGGHDSPIYHGQGGASKERKVDLTRFYQRVARGLETELGDDDIPLVLACDAQHRPGIQNALKRDIGLLPKQLEGNADALSESALHAATWPIVSDSFETPAQSSSPSSGDFPSRPLSEIVSHAVMGRIRTLRVPEHGMIPGCLDRNTGRAAEGSGDDDLIDHLVAEVLRRGGAIDVMEGESFSADGERLSAELW